MRPDIYREASEKQPPEDKVWFVVFRKQSKHTLHQMRWFLISGERERDQGWRGRDQVQDLQGHLLRKNSYRVVELSLANCYVPDRELSVRLSKLDFRLVWPENRQLHRDVGSQRNCI